MSPRNTEPKKGFPEVDVLASRLGRKLVIRLILVGLIPLVIFALPLYQQTRSILDTSSRTTLISYTKLAKGQVFMILEGASARLKYLASTDSRPADYDRAPFRRFFRLDTGLIASDGDTVPWKPLNPSDRALLARGRVVLTKPYHLAEASTASLIAPVPDGSGYLAGEMEPAELWSVARGGNYGPQDVLILLDARGNVLASSHESVQWPTNIFPGGLPAAARTTGDSDIPGLGECVWGFNDFWLEGAFGGERWGILAARSRAAVTELPLVLFKSLLILLLLAFCAIVIMSFREARGLLMPISRVADATRSVAEGEWDRRIEMKRDDELGDMIVSFNEMTRRLRETHDEKVRLTREAMVGRLAAMVAHQINTPLAATKSKLGIMKTRYSDAAADCDLLTGQVDRIGQIIKSLLGFAKLRSVNGVPGKPREIVENVEALFRSSFESAGVTFAIDWRADDGPISASPDDLQEVLVNLLENAREAVSGNEASRDSGAPPPTVTLRIETGRGEFRIIVEDDGPGLGADPERIFDPFFTTKTHGTGLGLAISRRICDAAGGSIRAENRSPAGTRFIARFPVKNEKEKPE
jgi:signal transduction histidine kinase